MPKKQVTAGKKARAAARRGEKYTTALRGHLAPGDSTDPDGAGVGAAYPMDLEHRSLIDRPLEVRAFRGTGLFARIGGQPAVDRLVDLLYEGIEGDGQLRPLFPRDLTRGRAMQKLFFAEWLDGPRYYTEQSYNGLRHSHEGVAITSARASRWLGHFRRAVEATIEAGEDRTAVLARARSLARALVSRQVAPGPPTGEHSRAGGPDAGGRAPEGGPRPVAWCGAGGRTVQQARVCARRGDDAGLGAVLAEAPDLLLPSYAAAIMQSAVLAGRTGTAAMLLDLGVSPDGPFYLPVEVTGRAFELVLYVTPLGAARMKRRAAAESLLLAAGAREDIFTSAFLGDLSSVGRMLAADPGLAQALDPAVSGQDITPVEHAVAGRQPDALRLILDHTTAPLPSGGRALRGAAEQGSVDMAELLLAHGADATRIGPGRWVLHPQLAPLLARHGASAGGGGAWIGASCTGNQGRQDDPEYVRALLRYGARATDRRTGDQSGVTGARALDATALHYAAKAGFLQTIGVLLEHGADPQARDSRGRTPLDWLAEAAPSVPRAAVRDLLVR